MIHARRITGEALAVSVPHNLADQIEYSVGGYQIREQVAPDGEAVVSCDEAEAAIDNIRGVLAEHFGIESTPLQWDGKDPLRLRKGSKDLPTGGREAQGAV
jgi:hypothetical protein